MFAVIKAPGQLILLPSADSLQVFVLALSE